MLEARLTGQPLTGVGQAVQNAVRLIGDRHPGQVEYAADGEDRNALIDAVARARDGQRPLPVFSSLFNRGLAAAVASIRVDGAGPANRDDWRRVLDALEVEDLRPELDSDWGPHVAAGHLPPLPASPAGVAERVLAAERRLGVLTEALEQVLPAAETLKTLFPFGLDVDGSLIGLELERLARALRANIKDDYQPPSILAALDSEAARGPQPVFQRIGQVRQAIGRKGVDEADILAGRNALTAEIRRLTQLHGRLEEVGRDLVALREAGAPDWAAACVTEPTAVERTLPADWKVSWEWAAMQGRIDRITRLGNGDALRQKKMGLLRRREQVFEQLIRQRTLLGLKRRLTGPVQTALSTFTSAIRRLGRGTGRSAVRWRKAIRRAALEAAPAAPVWVMPEHKVAEQLPAELADFDLVILDEASQSDITALGALARGRKHLIVGDEQQVSPSAVGIPQNKIDVLRAEHLSFLPNRDVIDENTSVFDIAMQMYPKTHLMLREHFRCVEPIIQFSTRFYSGRLIPIRVPKPSERFDPPLVDVFVKNGERRGKTNEAEARFIVEEIAAIARDPVHARRDIAVISLIGGEQATLIERMLIEDPRVGTEVMERFRIVCGDSRTLQGQERSIVFLSMVATPETARVQRSQGSAQRLNVALSRARDRLYLVRSVSTHDLRPGDLKLAVLEHFADPMPEGRALVGKGVLERCQSGFEREVCERLLDANYRVRSQVKAGPFSIDLVVEGADDRRLAIELDGDAWHGPDRWHEDMARQAALERAGWIFWRVFGSQWIADDGHWWGNLVATLGQMGIEPIGAEAAEDVFTEFRAFGASPDGDGDGEGPEGSEAAEATGLEASVAGDPDEPGEGAGQPRQATLPAHVDGEPHSGADSPGNVRPISAGKTPATPSTTVPVAGASAAEAEISDDPKPASAGIGDTADPSRFYDDDYRETLQSIGCGIVDEVGPMTFKHLCDRIARLHGFQRTGSEIRRIVDRAMRRARPRSHTRGDEEVFWPGDLPVAEWVRFRGLEVAGEQRTWAEIPFPERLGLARATLAEDPPEPEFVMSRAVGFGRLRARTRSEINAILARARQTLDEEGGGEARAGSNVTYLKDRVG
jgi:very-short-patch-repair endonuclease